MKEVDGLYDKLIDYTGKDYYPMHMPGHKRNPELRLPVDPYRIDITEIEGFDNLHQPEGVLRQLSERLEFLYGAKKSFPLINGSTAGILAGISAAAGRGGRILMARNSHKAVYHAVMMMGLKPVYLYPEQAAELPVYGGITSAQVENALRENKDVRLVVITSPTYEGVVSDIKTIAETVHRFGALLLVDEAHGAHFGFHPAFPENSVRLGADLVIQSLHKTLPAFTQTAVLHSSEAVPESRLRQYLAVYQSSSPSYLLMAGMDRCIHILEQRGRLLFDEYNERLQAFCHRMGLLKNLKLLTAVQVCNSGAFALDPSKLTISVRKTVMSGHELQTILRKKYHIEMEMSAPGYVLGMTSICDTEEGFVRLGDALLEIDRGLKPLQTCGPERCEKRYDADIIPPVPVMILQEAVDQVRVRKKLSESRNEIAAVFVSLYPPGVPLIVPGERISRELIDYISLVKQQGFTVTGLEGEGMDEIEVVKTI